MQGATGYGKTLVACEIVEKALAKGKRVLITVPALSLVDQTVSALWNHGVGDVGVIQASHGMTDASKPVQVASVQSLVRREAIPPADVVLVDECHVWFKWYEELLLGPERRDIPTIGLSATPWTKGLGKYYQGLIVAATTAELIERKVLAPFRVFAPAHPDLSRVRTLGGEFHQGDLGEAMDRRGLVADIVATWKERGEGRKTLCFAVNCAHAMSIKERFCDAGVAAAYMDSETPVNEREAIRRKLIRGEVQVVCNVDVVGLGVDWPELACVIYARPTRSEMRFVQNIGRGLRVSEGKQDLLILDHSDTHLRLGFVTDIGRDELDEGKKREAVDPGPRLPKECPACAYLKPPRTARCPNCGHVVEAHALPVKSRERPGSLEEMVASAKGRFKDKQLTYAMLAWFMDSMIAQGRKWKTSWAACKYKDLYGHWPGSRIDRDARCEIVPELRAWVDLSFKLWKQSRTKEEQKAREQAVMDRAVAQFYSNGGQVVRADATAQQQAGQNFVEGTLMTEQDMEDMR